MVMMMAIFLYLFPWLGRDDRHEKNSLRKRNTAKKEPHPSKYIKRFLYLEDDDNTTNKPTGQALLLLLVVHKKKGKWKKLNLFVCGCGFC
jgi:hypothetical protein